LQGYITRQRKKIVGDNGSTERHLLPSTFSDVYVLWFSTVAHVASRYARWLSEYVQVRFS
jgi:hypothetical protein